MDDLKVCIHPIENKIPSYPQKRKQHLEKMYIHEILEKGLGSNSNILFPRSFATERLRITLKDTPIGLGRRVKMSKALEENISCKNKKSTQSNQPVKATGKRSNIPRDICTSNSSIVDDSNSASQTTPQLPAAPPNKPKDTSTISDIGDQHTSSTPTKALKFNVSNLRTIPSKRQPNNEIIAYVHNLSPLRRNKKDTMNYCTLTLQTEANQTQEALLYSKNKRPILLNSAESHTPLKIQRFTEIHKDSPSFTKIYLSHSEPRTVEGGINRIKYDLRGNNMLSLPKVNTTKHGLNSFRYFAAKQWNSVPNELRFKAGGLEFNKQVRNIEF